MNFFKTEKADDEKKFFANNAQIVNNFNSKMFIDLIVIGFLILLTLSITSLVPFVRDIHPLFPTLYRRVFIIYTILYGIGTLSTIFFKKTIQKYPLPFLYTFYFSLYILGLYLNIKNPQPIPFVLLIGFRVMFPILMMDKKWRINIFNNIIITVAVFYFSYLFKSLDIFLIDVIISSVFTIMGMAVGGLSQSTQIQYIELKQNQLDSALEIEKAKSEAKTTFIANMSHEIRTPINSILGLDEMLLRESSDPTVIKYATDIRVSGNTLLKLINDILDFSKIEAGKMEIIPQEYNLSSVINDLLNMVNQKVQDKGLKLLVHVNEYIPDLLFGDEIRIKQCILNILNNAVKYTQKGSVTLDIDYEWQDNSHINLKVKVSDTGIGIRSEDLPKLSNAFERIDEKSNRTIEGTGLGMNIVNQLLEKMNSHLEVQSEYGKGSVFSFTIEQSVVWWDPIGDFTETRNRPVKITDPYVETFHAPDAKILIVDDTSMNLVVAEGLLKQTQVQVDTALSGKEMLSKVCKNHYDLIFIDHRMPIMDGVEAFHIMQQLEDNKCKDVPCIALTANVVSGAKENYIKEGFTDYLAKPIDSKLFERMIMENLPQNLVQRVRKIPQQNAQTQTETQTPEQKIQMEAENKNRPFDFAALKGINLEKAIENCGAEDIFVEVLRDYLENIPERSTSIAKFKEEHDVKNYTVLVHALKSSSRLIGALELSEQAAYLEKCGDENNWEEIEQKTPALLELYKSYSEKLAVAALPPLPIEEFKEALDALKEYATSEDFVSCDGIAEEVSNYTLPNGKKQFFEQIKRAIKQEDKEFLLQAISDATSEPNESA